MPLCAGSRLGPYEIVAPLGAGGMGEVYRARDPRMGREVAIKFSAERFSNRFESEVHAVAALNHPNICQVYDVGPNYLVMELIEGSTLSDRIKAGAIPFDEALAIARQIGEALEAAHEKGVVHRDLKPANIKIKPDGTVKVLDFGLAKIVEEAMAAGSPDESPTIPMGATIVGQIIGTAAYMAPEQARGNQVDKRVDIWAFGVVVYEMLTGRRLFEGTTVTDTLAQVLTKDPDLNGLQPGIRPLLRRCLARDPRKRLRDIGDARLELEGPVALFAPPSVTQPRRSEFFAWILAIAMTIAAAAITAVHLRQSPPVAPLVRFSVPPPEGGGYGSWLSLSPDGRYLGFTATGADGLARVWLRSLDSLQLRSMTGTEGSKTSGSRSMNGTP
jgi:serine/threonine-protein kinase